MKRLRERNRTKHLSRSPSPLLPTRELSTTQQILVLLVLSIAPFLPSINGEFVFDDAETVVNNPIVNGKHSITKLFERDFWGRSISSEDSHKSYRPLTTFTFWINYLVHGAWTPGFHSVNLVLHALVTVMVYDVTRHLGEATQHLSRTWASTKTLAFIAATFFSVHPVHTEAIANITGRSELLCAVFFLLGIRSIFSTSPRNLINYYVKLTVYAILAVLSKEQGITLLPCCVVLIWALSSSNRMKKTFILISITVVLAILRFRVNDYSTPKFSALDNAAAFHPNRVIRTVNSWYQITYHVGLLIMPWNLCVDYSMGCFSLIAGVDDLRWLVLGLIPVLLGLLIVLTKPLENSEQRIVLSAALLGASTFLPASNLLVAVGFTVAERVLYLPSIGYCILVAVGYRRLIYNFNRQNIDAAAVLCLLLAASKCYTRSLDWRDEFKLYTSALDVCPTNAKIHYNLGKVTNDKGNIPLAEIHYRNALRLRPDYEQALNNLANILENSGQHDEAERLLLKAVNVRPTFATAWMNLGISQMNKLKFAAGESSLLRSIKLRNSPDAWFNMGNLYRNWEQPEKALAAWTNATKIDPLHVRSWVNMLVVLDEMSLCVKVDQLTPKALAAGEGHPGLHSQIGSCLGQLGKYKEAEFHLKTALQFNPNNHVYHTNLGVLYQRWGQWGWAAAAYRQALSIDVTNQAARDNLFTVEQKLNSTHKHR